MTLENDITRLRRMIAEPSTDNYSDEVLTAALSLYPLMDLNQVEPDGIDWIATYDLNAAAADIWAEKAAAVVTLHAFSADGASYQTQQVYQQAMQQARYFAARRRVKATKVIGTTLIEDDFVISIGGEDD